MQRGIVNLSQQELTILYNLAVSQNCEKEDLVNKLVPVETQGINVLISEEEAEILLDLMPMPSDDNDPSLVSARLKIQQFISKSRFGV